MNGERTLRALGGNDACTLLAAMLQSKKTVIRDARRIRMSEDGEDAALVSGFEFLSQKLGRWTRAGKWRVHAIFQGLNDPCASIGPRILNSPQTPVRRRRLLHGRETRMRRRGHKCGKSHETHIRLMATGVAVIKKCSRIQAFQLLPCHGKPEVKQREASEKSLHFQRRRCVSKGDARGHEQLATAWTNPQNCAGVAHDSCCIKPNMPSYRPNAAIILRNSSGEILVCERSDFGVAGSSRKGA